MPSSGFPFAAASALAMSPTLMRASYLPHSGLGAVGRRLRPIESDDLSDTLNFMRGILSAPICRTGASIERRSPPSWGRVAARARAPSPATTRTPPRWPSRRHASPVARHRCHAYAAAVRYHLPAYADKTNATGVHAALQLPPRAAFDMGMSPRSALGALLLALSGSTAVAGRERRRAHRPPGRHRGSDAGRRRRRVRAWGATTTGRSSPS